MQGEISFDANGDIENRVISVFQITRNDKYPLDDVLHQYKYLGCGAGELVTRGPLKGARVNWIAARAMTDYGVLLQQVVNGLSLGAMYALLALGFTLVYGILELINFAHFNVFMVARLSACGRCSCSGISGQSRVLTGLALAGVAGLCLCGDDARRPA